MNKEEYWQTVDPRTDSIYKKVHNELKKWKLENHIAACCIVHHRDDNEEVRKYNELYYECWGCDEDGTFIEGKYVQFLTRAEHARHHHTGAVRSEATRKKMSENNAWKGKTFSEEHKQKLSVAQKGKKCSEEFRHKISEATQGDKNPFYGKRHSDGTRAGISNACKIYRGLVKELYKQYKESGGTLTWNAFQKHIVKDPNSNKLIFEELLNFNQGEC